MRRLTPTARSLMLATGRTAALAVIAVFAMAFGPAPDPSVGARAGDPVNSHGATASLDLDALANSPTLDLNALAIEVAPIANPTAISTEVPYHAARAENAVAADAPVSPGMRRISFIRPIKDFATNSVYGMRRLGGRTRPHEGIDIACPTGTPVLSASEGTILRAGFNSGGYGRFIEVQHPNGMTTFYAHLSRIDVEVGDAVNAGEQIGAVGSTGRSTGPHLHFEVRRNGEQTNPNRVMGASYEVAVASDSI